MGLRTRLTLLVVIGLLLAVGSALYIGAIPLQAGDRVTGGGGDKLVLSSGSSCGAGEAGSCSATPGGGECSDGGSCAMEKPAAAKQTEAKPAAEKQPAKAKAGTAK